MNEGLKVLFDNTASSRMVPSIYDFYRMPVAEDAIEVLQVANVKGNVGTVKTLYCMWNHSKLLNLEIHSVQEFVHLIREFLLLWTCHDFLVLSEVD